MNNLYNDLAQVYETMYQCFIDYELEYFLYKSFLEKRNAKSLLELGCGTGNLAQFFVKDNYDYRGIDLSNDMIKIAKKRNPSTVFMQGDMRFFKLEKPVESIIMTGRTISYLVKNEDVVSTLRSIHDNLKKGCVFCFDFIDANAFFPQIDDEKIITHKVQDSNGVYLRESKWDKTLSNGWSFNWESIFYRKENNNWKEIGKDYSTIRTFTKDEIELFLTLNGFEIRERIRKESYAFPTYVVVAERIT